MPQNKVKYGSWDEVRLGTGIALPAPSPVPYPGYTLPARTPYCTRPRSCRGARKCVVGLRSVAQLTLDDRFSETQGITEVYNLVETGNINNH